MAKTHTISEKNSEKARISEILTNLEIISSQLKEVLKQPNQVINEINDDWGWLREFDGSD